MITFPNRLVRHGSALPFLTQDQIRTMPMLYRASVPFALKTAPILWNFIRTIPVNPFDYEYSSLDVKVTMLKKGWYPCIPGWHCDDFWRPGTSKDSQPDIATLDLHNSKHFIVVYGSNSITEFLTRPKDLPDPSERGAKTVYGFYNTEINKWLSQFNFVSEGGVVQINPQSVYEFDSMSFHRGMPAMADGWRAFVRLTLGHVRPPKNEIRTQVNVYVPADQLEAGW